MTTSEEILCTRCRRTGHVDDPDFAGWESDGEADSAGRMLGVCPGCLTQEEEHEAVGDWIDDAAEAAEGGTR